MKKNWNKFGWVIMTIVGSFIFGAGYAIPSAAGVAAVKLMVRQEGIILDPVYTGKTFAGLLQLAEDGYFDGRENILFLHSGGAGGLFAIDMDSTQG